MSRIVGLSELPASLDFESFVKFYSTLSSPQSLVFALVEANVDPSLFGRILSFLFREIHSRVDDVDYMGRSIVLALVDHCKYEEALLVIKKWGCMLNLDLADNDGRTFGTIVASMLDKNWKALLVEAAIHSGSVDVNGVDAQGCSMLSVALSTADEALLHTLALCGVDVGAVVPGDDGVVAFELALDLDIKFSLLWTLFQCPGSSVSHRGVRSNRTVVSGF